MQLKLEIGRMKHFGTNVEGLKGVLEELGNILITSSTIHSLDIIEGKYLHRSMLLVILEKTGLQNKKILEKIVYVR